MHAGTEIDNPPCYWEYLVLCQRKPISSSRFPWLFSRCAAFFMWQNTPCPPPKYTFFFFLFSHRHILFSLLSSVLRIARVGCQPSMAETESPLISPVHPSRYAPVRERLLLALDGQTLVRLAQTSRAMHNSITSAWNVNTRLRRFFDDPVAFRAKLGQCDALIAGSFALQFFEGVVWRESGPGRCGARRPQPRRHARLPDG
jgi:hypothetical protein